MRRIVQWCVLALVFLATAPIHPVNLSMQMNASPIRGLRYPTESGNASLVTNRRSRCKPASHTQMPEVSAHFLYPFARSCEWVAHYCVAAPLK